ncbi:DUF4333 domain-containing protein [Actinomycetospora atypica]|uniref:DUF4333 domain-containing protein n=1 Tax=Actinomycetospora atypica TaxID=1290095 RepID=A0ABV9YGD9_9PSEU
MQHARIGTRRATARRDVTFVRSKRSTTRPTPRPPVAPGELGAEVARQANAEDVTCPQALPAQVGASTVCSGTLDGEQAQLGVTITAVQGSSVAFDIAKVG